MKDHPFTTIVTARRRHRLSLQNVSFEIILSI